MEYQPSRPTRCDSCGGLLDPEADVNRWRHRDCPVPPLPEAALDVLERVGRRKREVADD